MQTVSAPSTQPSPAPSADSHKSAPMQPGADPTQPRFRWDTMMEQKRQTLFPILNPDIWGFRKLLERLHWVVEDCDMSKDKKDWDTRCTPEEKHFIKYQLGLFAIFDNLVIKNLKENFVKRFRCMEAEAYLAKQEDQEWIHAEAYMLQAQGVVGGDELKEVLASLQTMPAVKAIIDWAAKYLDPSVSDGEALVAWALAEGGIFSASFAGIQWLRDRNMLPGMTEFNQFIARDEGVHCLFTCHLVTDQLIARAPRTKVHAIVREAFAVTSLFINASLPHALHNMTAPLMEQYTQFQFDSVLALMRYKPLYSVENPFRFMDKLSLNAVAKANFFERRASQYGGPEEGSLDCTVDKSEIQY